MSEHIEKMTVGEVMTKKPVTVHPKTGVKELKKLFETREFNSIPVVEENGVLRGLATKIDLLRMFRPDRRSLIPDMAAIRAEKVEDIMSRGYVDVSEGDPVVTAVDLMMDLNLRALPVTERTPEGRILKGIVTRKDVLSCFVWDE